MNPKPRLWWLCGSRITSTCASSSSSSVSLSPRLSSSHITTGRERRRVPTNGKPYHPDRRDIESSSSPSRVAFASRSRTSTTGPNCEKKFLTTPASRASTHIARRRQSPHRASRARLVERIPRSSRRARARPPSSPRAPSSTVRSSPPTNIFDPAAASLAPMESPMVVDDDAVRRDRARARDRVARARDSSTGRDRWMSVSSRDSIRMGHTTMATMARETRWARRETRSRARETTAERETTATRARLASRVSLASSRRRASGGATDARSRVRRAGEAVPVRRVPIRSSARARCRGVRRGRERAGASEGERAGCR